MERQISERQPIDRRMGMTAVAVGILQLVLALGFFTGQSWATSLWPVPDTPLSYAFIAAILAGGAAPLLWTGLSGERGGLPGYGLSFGVMYAGMALTALVYFLRGAGVPLIWFAIVVGAAGILCIRLYLRARGNVPESPPTPRIVRIAFVAEVVVLAGAGILLLLQVPNTLPWRLSPESSVLYGWVFVGLAFYYLYAVLKPYWVHAQGPLLGFLVYDLVLAGPLFARFGSLQPEHVRGQIAASAIIVFSAVLAVYYLFLNDATRLQIRPRAGGGNL